MGGALFVYSFIIIRRRKNANRPIMQAIQKTSTLHCVHSLLQKESWVQLRIIIFIISNLTLLDLELGLSLVIKASGFKINPILSPLWNKNMFLLFSNISKFYGVYLIHSYLVSHLLAILKPAQLCFCLCWVMLDFSACCRFLDPIWYVPMKWPVTWSDIWWPSWFPFTCPNWWLKHFWPLFVIWRMGWYWSPQLLFPCFPLFLEILFNRLPC